MDPQGADRTDAPQADLARIQALAGEDDGLRTARERAGAGVAPDPAVGALLRWLAATLGARTAVEVGAAGGVTGCWLLPGMDERGTLTSIEVDRDAHTLATDALAAAGLSGRVRSIVGDPAVVLPRLSDGAYDLVLAQGGVDGRAAAIEHAARLLRPGGILVVRASLADTPGLAEHLHADAEDSPLRPLTLPLDVDGLTLATRRD
jgi:predicted O-methyltransferase YrrM